MPRTRQAGDTESSVSAPCAVRRSCLAPSDQITPLRTLTQPLATVLAPDLYPGFCCPAEELALVRQTPWRAELSVSVRVHTLSLDANLRASAKNCRAPCPVFTALQAPGHGNVPLSCARSSRGAARLPRFSTELLTSCSTPGSSDSVPPAEPGPALYALGPLTTSFIQTYFQSFLSTSLQRTRNASPDQPYTKEPQHPLRGVTASTKACNSCAPGIHKRGKPLQTPLGRLMLISRITPVGSSAHRRGHENLSPVPAPLAVGGPRGSWRGPARPGWGRARLEPRTDTRCLPAVLPRRLQALLVTPVPQAVCATVRCVRHRPLQPGHQPA